MNVSPVYHGAPAESRTPVEDRTYAALEELGIPFDRVDHDPAEDMADCAVISQALGADICKNLLLTPRNRSAFYLLAMPGDKPFVTKELSKQIGSSRLSFATAEDLEQLSECAAGLGVGAGTAERHGAPGDAGAGSGGGGKPVVRLPSLPQYQLPAAADRGRAGEISAPHRPCAAGGGALIMKLCAGEGRYILSGADFFHRR